MGNCLVCGNYFETDKVNKDRHKFCSKECWESRYIPKYKYNCEKCGVEFYSKFKTTRFCSKECYLDRNFKTIKNVLHKKCSTCKEFKILSRDNFYNSKSTKDRYGGVCIECNKKNGKRRNGDEVHIARCRKYHLNNKNKAIAYRLRPDIKQRQNLNEALRKKNDPHFALKCRMRILMYASIRKVKNARTWQSIVGYSVDDLRLHIESLFTGGMSWERFMNGEIHIDHKLPVSSFNYKSTEDEEFQKCWALDNLQPLWSFDNISKGNKIINNGDMLCRTQENQQS
jgi:hypothetical protein